MALRTSGNSQAAAAGQLRQAEALDENPPATQTNVTVLVMDSFVPTIPDPATNAIEAKFLHKTLTKVEGQPTYNSHYKRRSHNKVG